MADKLDIAVITVFPAMLNGFLRESMMKRAEEKGAAHFSAIDPREFTTDRHRTTDDRPYGGGPGMVMKPEPLFKAVESVRKPDSRVILTTPQGHAFHQDMAAELAHAKHLVFVCGHYEGVDERIREHLVTDEISIGDYVLTNGVLAAAVIIDAVVRLLPGVLGAGESAVADESFSSGQLEYPQYTRPENFRGMQVPDVLLSGNHQEIARWRRDMARERTRDRRPDLLDKEQT